MGSEVVAKITTDHNLIKRAAWATWDEQCADYLRNAQESFEPDPRDMWFSLSCGEVVLGACRLRLFAPNVLQFCPNIFPKYRAKKTKACAVAINRFLLELWPSVPHIIKVVGFVPVCFQNVVDFGVKSGWKIDGYVSRAFVRDGQTHDIAQVCITRKELEKWVQSLEQQAAQPVA